MDVLVSGVDAGIAEYFMKFLIVLLLAMGVTLCAQGQGQPMASATTSAGLPGGSNLPSQKIRSNDLIGVTVIDEPSMTRTVRVDPEGMIRLPLLKDKVKADGLMPEQLEKAIAHALLADQIRKDADVTVTVAEYFRPLRPLISVVGAVRTPITFQSVETVTLLEAITRAGGVTPDAGSEILISRSVQKDSEGNARDGRVRSESTPGLVERVRVKSLIDDTDPSANLILTGGEEIRVPEVAHEQVFVFGNVKKPGTIPIKAGDDSTVFKAIALSEGLAPYAAKQAYIFRREGGGNSRNEIPVDLKKIVDHKAPDVPLLANDILYVPDNTGRRNTVSTLKIISAVGLVALSAIIYVALR